MEPICVFCKTSSSPLKDQLGEIFKIGRFHCHTNCLIFSFSIRQNPDRTKGLYGFEANNIDLAIRRCENMICVNCQERGATIRCFGKDRGRRGRSCQTSYHLPCALQSKNTLHRSYGKYATYCWNHNESKCKDCGKVITGIQHNTTCCDELYNCDECIRNYVNNHNDESIDPIKCPKCKNVDRFKNFVKNTLKLKIRQSKQYIVESSSESDATSEAEESQEQTGVVSEDEERQEQTGVTSAAEESQEQTSVTPEAEESREEEDSGDVESMECTSCGSNPVSPRSGRESDINSNTELVSSIGDETAGVQDEEDSLRLHAESTSRIISTRRLKRKISEVKDFFRTPTKRLKQTPIKRPKNTPKRKNYNK